jgi:hypothetical protein
MYVMSSWRYELLLRNQQLLTLDEQAIRRDARAIASENQYFLANREENLIDKVLAIGTMPLVRFLKSKSKLKSIVSMCARFWDGSIRHHLPLSAKTVAPSMTPTSCGMTLAMDASASVKTYATVQLKSHRLITP